MALSPFKTSRERFTSIDERLRRDLADYPKLLDLITLGNTTVRAMAMRDADYVVSHVVALEDFRVTAYSQADLVNVDGDLDWYDLAIGWGLGKGMTPDNACAFAEFITWKTNMW